MHSRRSFRLATMVLLCGLAASGRAQDEKAANPIEAALAREIIGPKRAMLDAQDFIEPRIPAVPEVKSAEEWTRTAEKLRADALEKVVFRGQASAWRDAECRVEWLDTLEVGPGYRIKKLRYEALPGLWIPALLYEPAKLEGKVPVVLNVNGHDAKGKAADYKQIRCINLAKRGILALNLEWIGMGQLRGDGFNHGLIDAIDLCGTAGIATHFLAMKRGIDILLAHPNADPARVGVTGLSGGGWQTIFISPLDPRVTLTDPVAGYSSFLTRIHHFSDLGDSEQTPSDLATVLDYAHLTAMMAPHPTLLSFNFKDNCCFASPHALPPLVAAAAPIFSLFNSEANLRAHVNVVPGDHNYGLDNRQALYRMIKDHWFAGNASFSAEEIPSDSEVQTAEALDIPLPDDNLDLNRIAIKLAAELPRESNGTEGAGVARRERLRAIVRPFEGGIRAEDIAESDQDGITITHRNLRLAESWSVPAVEFSPKDAKNTVLLIADEGRKSAAERVQALLLEGKRVVAIDPFYFGEAHPAERDYLWGLLIGTIGERPLGVQAGQVISVARWLKHERGEGVTLEARGPRTSLIALAAAALEPEAIADVTLHKPLGSLKELLETKRPYQESPEAFCFGLLEAFDMRQLAGLVAPRPVTITEPGERAAKELAEIIARSVEAPSASR